MWRAVNFRVMDLSRRPWVVACDIHVLRSSCQRRKALGRQTALNNRLYVGWWQTFEYWEQKRQQLRKQGRDFEAEFDGVFLEVASYTTKEELLAFVNDYFDNHLKPLLRTTESPFTPVSLREGRVREPEKRNELIIGWHKSGKTPREIEALLGFELDISSIRRIIRKNS